MFPLGTVLFPFMPLSLHVFEERYRRLVHDALAAAGAGGVAELGVVLIERGQEVGGGDERFDIGTVARVVEVGQHPDGRFSLAAVGARRLLVRSWLPDDPYPLAEVTLIEDIDVCGSEDLALLARADLEVRRCLRLQAEIGEPSWPPTVELDDHPTAAAWQLAAIAPLSPLDQLALLRSRSSGVLLQHLTDMAAEQAAVLAFRRDSG